MNKEKFMQLVSEAFDNGAYIDIVFSQYDKVEDKFIPNNEHKAKKRIELARAALGGVIENPDYKSIAPGFTLNSEEIRIHSAYVRGELKKYA